MSNIKLRDNVFKNFNNMIKLSTKFLKLENDLTFHNKSRMQIHKKGIYTYEGKKRCGVTSLILGNLLKKQNLKVDMKLSINKYNDHVFLKYNDLIIDPTYRQFLSDERKSHLSNYNNYLYTYYTPIYVGTKDNLFKLIKNLDTLNKKEFKNSIINNDIYYNWEEHKDITYRFDKYY